MGSDISGSSGADRVADEAIYMLVGMAMLNWMLQLMLDLFQPSPKSYTTKFCVFASAMFYNFYSIIHCLVLVLRGHGMVRWQQVFHGCRKRSLAIRGDRG